MGAAQGSGQGRYRGYADEIKGVGRWCREAGQLDRGSGSGCLGVVGVRYQRRRKVGMINVVTRLRRNTLVWRGIAAVAGQDANLPCFHILNGQSA